MSFDIRVAKRLGDTTIDLDLAAERGVTVLFGPSGVGKSTILNMVAGLVKPDGGRIAVDGETLFDSEAGIDLPPERRRAGYVFQEPRLFPHQRVRANLLYGAPAGTDPAPTVEMLGIGHLLDRWPRHLSGGEAKRVAIGRALLSAPRFLLLDEPLSSLDRPRRAEVMTALETIRDRLNLPMLLVTHEPEEAERLGTTIVRL